MELPSITTNNTERAQATRKREYSSESSNVSLNSNNIQNNANNSISRRSRNSEIVKLSHNSSKQRGDNSQSPKQQIHNSVQQNQSNLQQLSDKQSNQIRNSKQIQPSQIQQSINSTVAVATNQCHNISDINQVISQQQSSEKLNENNKDSINKQQSLALNSVQQHQGNTYFHDVELQDFEILSKLGEGSFSTVYRVRRGKDGKEYALKRIKMMKLNEKERENSVNEVRFLASINCNNIISYKQAIYDEGVNQLCVIMEFAEGGDLARIIRYAQKAGKYIEEDVIWSYAIQMTNGIKALHDLNILHRDLKAANVFLDKNQTRIMLGDLNVSKKLQSNGLLYTQTGTPYYASPEVWQDKPYNNKSDIWSLGCVIYEMCSLKPPFKGKDMEDLFKKVKKGVYEYIPSHFSNELSTFISQLLRVNPDQRLNCDEILKLGIIKKKMNDIQQYLSEPISIVQSKINSQLISTIRIGNSLRGLKDKLPQARYEEQHQSPSQQNQQNQVTRQRKQKHNSHSSSGNINEPIILPHNVNSSLDISDRGLNENQKKLHNLNINSIQIRQSQGIQSQKSSTSSQQSPSNNQINLQKYQIKQQQKQNQQQKQQVSPSPPQTKSRCSSVEIRQSLHKNKDKSQNPLDEYYYNSEAIKQNILNSSQNSVQMEKKVLKDNAINNQQPNKNDDTSSINQSIQQLSKEIKMLNQNIFNEEMSNRQKQLNQLKVLQQILHQKRSISLHKGPQYNTSQDQSESRSISIDPLLVNSKINSTTNTNQQIQRSSLNSQYQTPILPRIANNSMSQQNSGYVNQKQREGENLVSKRIRTESTYDSNPTTSYVKNNNVQQEDQSKSMIYSNNQININSHQRRSQIVQRNDKK